MDDGYACGPPSVVFAAVARFGARVRAALGLVLNDKLECWSQLHDITACHHRQHHLPEARVAGLSLPELADIYGRPQHAPCYGITVGRAHWRLRLRASRQPSCVRPPHGL
eukprot:295238-Prymnesium_polylepis.1